MLDRWSNAAVLAALGWYYRNTWVPAPSPLSMIGTVVAPHARAQGEGLGRLVNDGMLQRVGRVMSGMPPRPRAVEGWRRRRLARTLAASLLATAATTASATPAVARGLLQPAELPSDDYAETFTFVADLDDGTYVQLQLAVTNLGPGSGTGLCRALVKRPAEAAWTRHERKGRSGWSYRAGEDGEVLSVGGCWARSGAQTVVHAALGGRAVELTFPGPLSELAPPTVIQVRNREYRAWVLQAFTAVTARLEGFRGAAPQAGGGYADHSRTTVPAGALGRRWVRFRALRPPNRVLVLARQLPDGRWDPAWIWRQGDAPRPLDGVELLRPRGAGGAWSVTLRDGPAAATVSTGERLYRHAPLEELGPMAWVAKAVMEVPVTTTYRATLSARTPADGVLEVSILGKE